MSTGKPTVRSGRLNRPLLKIRTWVRRRLALLKSPALALRATQLRHQLHLQRCWWTSSHQPYQPLFILATPRSGSYLLLDYVSHLEGVSCLGEIFNPMASVGWQARLTRRQSVRHMRYSFQSLSSPIRACKLHLYDFKSHELAIEDIHATFPAAKYLILYRQSLAQQFVSFELAKKTNQWMTTRSDQPQQVPVTIDAQELRVFCAEVRDGYQELLAHKWLSNQALLLSYEELTADPAYWLRLHICPFLDVAPAEPQSKWRKQNTKPLSERITNYQEVSSLLQSPMCRQHLTWPDAAYSVGRAA